MATVKPIAPSFGKSQSGFYTHNIPHPERGTWLAGWTTVLLLTGICWRALRYIMQFPIWGDEGMLCLNFLNQNYAGFLQGMKYCQVAPILFLWGELTIYNTLGGSELAIRLLPELAGVFALVIFWILARKILPPLGSTMAVGILAVSYYAVRHATEVKPYSFDLLASVTFMYFACDWLKDRARLQPLIYLCVLVIPLLGLSNPAVFVAAAVSIVLLAGLRAERNPSAWWLWVLYNVLLCAGFAIFYQINLAMQSPESIHFLDTYWANSFPPDAWSSWPKWLLLKHTGNLMAYPMGGANGGSSLTLILFIIGAVILWKKHQRLILSLCLIPFLLTFIAACLHRYPYGGSARISQHLAPAICLLAGLGLATLITRCIRIIPLQRRVVVGCCAFFVLFGLLGMVRDLAHPFKESMDRENRHLIETMVAEIEPNAPLVLMSEDVNMQSEYKWYLFQRHEHVLWNAEVDWDDLARNEDKIIMLRIWQSNIPDYIPAFPHPQSAASWKLMRRDVHKRSLTINPAAPLTEISEVLHWKKQQSSGSNKSL